jgi:hypothetical protein
VRNNEKTLEVLRQKRVGQMAKTATALEAGVKAIKYVKAKLKYLKLQREFLRLEGFSKKELPALSAKDGGGKSKKRTPKQLLPLLQTLFNSRVGRPQAEGGGQEEGPNECADEYALRRGNATGEFTSLFRAEEAWMQEMKMELVHEVAGKLAAEQQKEQQNTGKKRKGPAGRGKGNRKGAKEGRGKRAKLSKLTDRSDTRDGDEDSEEEDEEESAEDEEGSEEDGEPESDSESEDDSSAPWAGKERPWTAAEVNSWEWPEFKAEESGATKELLSAKDGGRWTVYCCRDDDTLESLAAERKIEVDELLQMAEINPCLELYEGIEHKGLKVMTLVVVGFVSGT